MKYFWDTVLFINSGLLICASIFLVYSLGMLVISFEWQRFLLALTILVVLIGTEMVFAGMLHT